MQPSFVIDASVVLAWYNPHESNAFADSLLERLDDDVAVTPKLCVSEVNNILGLLVKKRMLSHMQADRMLIHLTNVRICLDEGDEGFYVPRTKILMEEGELTFYDATYLALAYKLDLPIATLDKQMIRAARISGIPLVSECKA